MSPRGRIGDGFRDSCLWALAALAAAVRFLPLPWRFVHNDELLQLFIATRGSVLEAWAVASAVTPQQPPLDYLLGFLAARLHPGISFLRLLPALWGVGSVLIAYRLGTELRGKALGAFWGLLLALSVLHVEFSQTLRQYSLITFLMLASTWLFLGVWEGRRRLWPWAAVLGLFGLCYPYATAVAAVQLAFLIRRRGASGALRPVVAAGCAMLPFLIWFCLGGRAVLNGEVFNHPSEGQFHAASLWRVLRDFSGNSPWTGALFLALGASGAWAGWRAGCRASVLLGGALLAGVVGLAAAAQLNVQYAFRTRHVIAALPIFLGFVAAGCAALLQGWEAWRGPGDGRERSLRAAALSAALVLLCAGSLLDYLNFEARAVRRFADEVSFLRRSLGPEDAVLFSYPNAAATFLLAAEPAAFPGAGELVLSRNVVLFRLRAGLRLWGRRVFTLCSLDPALATLDGDGFAALERELRGAGGRLWLVQASWNSFPGDYPFQGSLGIPAGRMLRRTPAIYELIAR